MSAVWKCVLLLALIVSVAEADTYLHNPRGSNNRLNEQGAARANGNRLFDSQNNNRGGYNVGDRIQTAFQDNQASNLDPSTNYIPTDTTTSGIYPLVYYEGSILPVEWTLQHGCGGNEAGDPTQQNCNLVFQYTCENTVPDYGIRVTSLQDGTNTNTPDEPTNAAQVATTTNSNTNNRRGRHESEEWYYACRTRNRNRGLFLADQNLQGTDSRYTRQNNNGNRRGLECPEERDYYPYWAPTPWIDIVYITDHPEQFCTADGLLDTTRWPSQNNVPIFRCTQPGGQPTNPILAAITPETCLAATGVWASFSWNIPAPLCQAGDWSRPNHLGNGRFGQPLTYNWTLPLIASIPSVSVTSNNFVKCVFRMRYNISTDDYDPWNTTSRYNNNPNGGVTSPVTQNPTVDVGAGTTGLRLAVNTAQFGRTFEDRSHTFYIRRRPAGFQNRTIYNLNVRGKRCNIVQCYPAVEYDFAPNRLTINSTDLIHLQWTGSNTHNNGNPGGDGQTGDAGEGRTGTDRHNLVEVGQNPPSTTSVNGTTNPPFAGDISQNFPLPLDKYPDNIWSRSTCYNLDGSVLNGAEAQGWVDCAITVATSGFFRSRAQARTDGTRVNPTLDTSPASLIGGVIIDFSTGALGGVQSKTSYDYINTRNNNFSNRGTKGVLIVQP